jgi:hypothetical protein
MPADSPEEGFRVTDRRRRSDDVGRETASAAPSEPLPPPPPEPARDLTGLFVMFASSALIAMGESPDPLTGRTETDLTQAAEAIDTLMLLREKTEGNRTPEEDQLLGQVLYDLQLRFVRATKAAPSG